MAVLTASTADPVLLAKVDVLAVDAHSLRAVHVSEVRALGAAAGWLTAAWMGWLQ
jgi:hypothetical protein